MAMKLYSDVDIQDIANAIREKNGQSTTYKVSDMAAAIGSIPSVSVSSKTITANGTYTAPSGQAYSPVTVNVPVPKAKQANLASSSIRTTTYSTTLSMTVEKTGTYKVSWVGVRNSNGGTNGSQLYIGGSAYGTARTNFDENPSVQQVLLTGVALTAGQTVEVRARARGTNYYMTVANFVIEEE